MLFLRLQQRDGIEGVLEERGKVELDGEIGGGRMGEEGSELEAGCFAPFCPLFSTLEMSCGSALVG